MARREFWHHHLHHLNIIIKRIIIRSHARPARAPARAIAHAHVARLPIHARRRPPPHAAPRKVPRVQGSPRALALKIALAHQRKGCWVGLSLIRRRCVVDNALPE